MTQPGQPGQQVQPRLHLRPNHLWRIAVICSLAADILEEHGIVQGCIAVGTHGRCPDAGPCCVYCAIIAARLRYTATGAPEVRDLPDAVMADAMLCAQTHAEADGLVIDPPDTAEAVQVLRLRARILFQAALPRGEGLYIVGRRPPGRRAG
jgi:hypothetical protein